jgi:hypothetical protein
LVKHDAVLTHEEGAIVNDTYDDARVGFGDQERKSAPPTAEG